MENRRSFIAGMLAVGLAPKPTWADAGNPDLLSAAKKPDGNHVLCGLGSDGSIKFEIHLPARGHAAAAHPKSPEAVAFARRPGTYAIVLDCRNGRQKARLEAPAGRHFFGHGAFSADGDLLFTTENDYEANAGIVGVWDVRKRYVRMGEFISGGIGPHDIKLMPDGDTLVVANGGIETHPETGRTKLNLPTMRSNLSYLQLDGTIAGQLELSPEHQRNSIRHLAVSKAGDVAFAMQWQGDLTSDLPLLGVDRRASDQTELLKEASIRKMRGYLGSVAFDPGTGQVAATSPRSGILQVFDRNGVVRESYISDVCGVAASGGGFVVTSGTGLFRSRPTGDIEHEVAWDNHLIAI